MDREDRERLVRIETKLDEHLPAIHKRLDAHAGKIRSLELTGKWVGGIAAGVGLVWGALKLHLPIKQGS